MCLKKIHCICFKFYFLESASCFLFCLRVVINGKYYKWQILLLLQISKLGFCSVLQNFLFRNKSFSLGYRPSNNSCQTTLFSTLLVSWILDIPPSENYVLLPMIQWVQTGFGIIAQRTPIVSCDFVTRCSSNDHGSALIQAQSFTGSCFQFSRVTAGWQN